MENTVNILQGVGRNNEKETSFSVEEYRNKTQNKEAENTYSDLENNNISLADLKANMSE